MPQIMNMKPVFVSIGLSLSLCVACGGSDAGGNGSAGSSASSGGSGNPGGNANHGGSAPGAGSGGNGSSAAGGPSTNSGSYSSGLPGDKVLGSLTDDEAAGLCKKLSDYFSDDGPVSKRIEDVSCRFSSVLTALFTNPQTDAALQASCKSLYDSCVAGPLMTSETCNKPDAACAATVAEYDACVNDELDALNQLLGSAPSCDEVTLMSASGSLGSGLQPTAACQKVQSKCPSAPTPPGFDDFSDSNP